MRRWLSICLLVLAATMGAALWSQRQTSDVLRGEIAWLREEGAELARLRAENERLSAAQMPADELARLRNDHMAVMRLLGEIEKSRESLGERERALAERKAAQARARAGSPAK